MKKILFILSILSLSISAMSQGYNPSNPSSLKIPIVVNGIPNYITVSNLTKLKQNLLTGSTQLATINGTPLFFGGTISISGSGTAGLVQATPGNDVLFKSGDVSLGVLNYVMGNMFVGENSGGSTRDGILSANNTGYGTQSIPRITTAYQVTSIGSNSGYRNTTGFDNTFVGAGADADVDNLNNATAIGKGAIVKLSNQVQIGNEQVTSVRLGGPNSVVQVGSIIDANGNPIGGGGGSTAVKPVVFEGATAMGSAELYVGLNNTSPLSLPASPTDGMKKIAAAVGTGTYNVTSTSANIFIPSGSPASSVSITPGYNNSRTFVYTSDYGGAWLVY